MDGASSAKYDVVSILACSLLCFLQFQGFEDEIQSTRENGKGLIKIILLF
jgi:hypothetical protein